MRLGFAPKDGDSQIPDVHAGDSIAVITQARLPLLYRDVGAFDRREFLSRQNIDVVATLRASKLLEVVSTPPPSIQTRIAQLRARLHRQIDELFPESPQTAGILSAMLLGDRSFVDRTESVDFQKTGVFHVLVIAGLHIGALAFFLSWLFCQLRIPRTLAVLLLLVVLFTYIAVVEQRPPVLRAGIMTAIVVLGGLFYRRLDLLNSASLAALILLVAKPKSVLDNSFQLSFLAIGCIAGLALPWMECHVQPYVRALRGWRDHTRDVSFDPLRAQFRLDLRSACPFVTLHCSKKAAPWLQDCVVNSVGISLRVSELLVMSCVLQLGMLPLMARDFHRISLLGPLANLFAVPLTGIIVPVGFFSVGISFTARWIEKLCAYALTWLMALQSHIVSGLARFPAGSYRIPSPPEWVLFFFFGAALLLAIGQRTLGARRRWFTGLGTAGIVAGIIVIASYPFAPSVTAKTLEVTVLDVAQGDSILVVSPRGSTLLIDGGGAFQGFRGREEHLGSDPGEDAVSPYLWSRGFKELNAVAVTHAHQDHIGGLTAILQNFRVGRVWIGNDNASPALSQFRTAALERHVPVEHELRGQSFLWDGVQIDFLWPESDSGEDATSVKNNDSLVIRLRYGNRTILLPG